MIQLSKKSYWGVFEQNHYSVPVSRAIASWG
jgi:hypothetical protein